ncbi:hypothetical protein M407DRAFT_27001 [Tulasnella calospora MUT 4182]|uniref:Tetratricopeptide repeat protein 29 n=1 Tax=Tulasnella calospora MUT 4182 TaxID=1051891 RepID=A0A0C3QEP9_9AGAM|nr:hypothetical protein M407DRAFT_27001 [Tulasnella calospora MUT 4182]
MASVFRKQAAVSYRYPHHEEALEAASSALEKYRSLDDVVGMAEASYWKGCSLMMLNKEDDAVPILEKAHGIFQAEDDHVGVFKCLERLGELQRRKGDIAGALLRLQDAVTLASSHGDKLGEARALLPLGSAYLQSDNIENNIEEGTSTLLTACQVARNIGWCHGLCVALSRLGTVNTRNGAYQEAERYFQESISVAREASARLRVAQSLSQLGECFRTQERLDEAAEKFEEACCVFYEISFAGRDFVFAASAYAAVQRRRGSTQDAIFWYDQAIFKCQYLKDAYAVSWHLREKAEALLELGWYDEAALNFEASIVVRMESGVIAV